MLWSGERTDMGQELADLFERNFPFVVREHSSVLRILGHEGNAVFAERDSKNRLIGAAVVNRGTILMLCVDRPYRRQGIGSRLSETVLIILRRVYRPQSAISLRRMRGCIRGLMKRRAIFSPIGDMCIHGIATALICGSL